jgi:hypothetical protein
MNVQVRPNISAHDANILVRALCSQARLKIRRPYDDRVFYIYTPLKTLSSKSLDTTLMLFLELYSDKVWIVTSRWLAQRLSTDTAKQLKKLLGKHGLQNFRGVEVLVDFNRPHGYRVMRLGDWLAEAGLSGLVSVNHIHPPIDRKGSLKERFARLIKR